MFDNRNSADLQDSMTASWNPQLVKGVISTAVAEVHPDVVRALASRYPLKGYVRSPCPSAGRHIRQ
jgi:hypothetical protein